jgi:mono/diheme cytochrome c family protein
MKRSLIILFNIVLAAVFARGDVVANGANSPAGLAWDSTDKRVVLPGMTNRMQIAFALTNTSPEEVTILSAETTCECTVVDAATKFPWRLAPSEAGVLKVNVNTRGNYGVMEKSLVVKTSKGIQKLDFHLTIPLSPAPFNRSVREQDVEVARADRQAVFKGHCAACHSLPAKHLEGAILYEKACAICHNSEHRAEFVPDLAALKRPMDEDSWREIISHGKPGTLMPAFDEKEGGSLDIYQIHSLVLFLSMKYPPGPEEKVSNIPPKSQ